MAHKISPEDLRWMERAISLARRGEALASPNPMVGAVLVRGGRAVGEGSHTYDGLKHAEILALEAAGGAARGSTLYINLEPCCHTGRTGPCTRALIAAGVKRVVAAMPDPNPRVSGRGLRELRAAGIRAKAGGLPEKLERDSRQLNEAFATWITKRRPFVTLKVAMTLDGHTVLPPARNAKRARWITSEASRAEVHRMRHASDAILTGIGTVLADDPLLTDRTGLPRRRPLLRVVLDSRLRLSPRSQLARSAKGDVLVFTCASETSPRARALQRKGIEIVRVRGRSGRPDLRAVLAELARRNILSVLLEAGDTLNAAALGARLVDKVRLFYAPLVAGPVAATQLDSRPRPEIHKLSDLRVEEFGPDFAVEGYLPGVRDENGPMRNTVAH
jgi:diaminohydroxyphosphoribosylaminopyrimidine deaminase/5-amino-6-(5-phosphoribosylamino)uracil reductase